MKNTRSKPKSCRIDKSSGDWQIKGYVHGTASIVSRVSLSDKAIELSSIAGDVLPLAVEITD